jgi:putative nucleotidyltransferase with HDIG domain
VGADGLLARVGSYYHDIGKTVRPLFFAENRGGDIDPHEHLDPATSAQIVLSHVQDGLDLAEKYNLPEAIRAFIPEHQGKGLTLSFYRMAVKAAEATGQPVDEATYRYPGPRPQSQETAIVMLADSCEARVRSARPSSPDEIDRILRETIKYKLDHGELGESDLTLRDLDRIREAFLSVLMGMFHARVAYPEPVTVKGPDGQEIIR